LFPFHLSFSFFTATGKLFGEKTLSEMTLRKIGRYASYCYGQKFKKRVQIFNANINTAGPENHLRLCVRQLTIGKKVRVYRVGEPLKHHRVGDTFETSPRKNERKKNTQSPT